MRGEPPPQISSTKALAVQFQWWGNTNIDLTIDDVAFATTADYVSEDEIDTSADDGDPGSGTDVDGGATADGGQDAASPMAGASAVDGTCTCRAVGQAASTPSFLLAVLDLLFR